MRGLSRTARLRQLPVWENLCDENNYKERVIGVTPRAGEAATTVFKSSWDWVVDEVERGLLEQAMAGGDRRR